MVKYNYNFEIRFIMRSFIYDMENNFDLIGKILIILYE